jgi:predicted metal-dependent HD superfamily phosphohydrolase
VIDLRDAWLEAVGPSAPPAAVSRVGDELIARWSEPHRHYHTLKHLATVLRIISDHASAATDPGAVRLAAWFHDAVYDPRRVDNEEASALLAELALPALTIAPDRVAEVARLVRLTASHDPAPGDRNGGLITDADLAVLAADPDAYWAYTRAIRREYGHVPEVAFTEGRAAVLRNLLELPVLFHTPALRHRWEDAARHNLTAELRTLTTVQEGAPY